ncbi:hypothetical protein, partial [Campylobacter sp. JMF_03 NE3]
QANSTNEALAKGYSDYLTTHLKSEESKLKTNLAEELKTLGIEQSNELETNLANELKTLSDNQNELETDLTTLEADLQALQTKFNKKLADD